MDLEEKTLQELVGVLLVAVVELSLGCRFFDAVDVFLLSLHFHLDVLENKNPV